MGHLLCQQPHRSIKSCTRACDAQARKQAQAIEASLRLERLSQQAGSSMVTTKSFASMDEDGLDSEAVLQRLNIILKARPRHPE